MIALHYRRLEHRRDVESVVEGGRKAGLFLSRKAMIAYLLSMYDRAEKGDVIWGQCVRCADFTTSVRPQILKAAGNGARFQMIINKYSPSLDTFNALFAPIHSARIAQGEDNAVSFQGLSDKEVVLGFPGIEAYTAVLIRDRYFTKIIKAWFDKRFRNLAAQPTAKA